MEGSTKKRIIFWTIVFLLFIFLGIFGRIGYYNGHGKSGKIRAKLMDVANNFNSLDYIIRFGNLSTDVTKNKLIVIYNNGSSKIKYEYKYNKENNIETISNEFPLNESVGTLIAKGICDSVYRVNNGVNSIFDEYEFKEFTKTKVEDGINITNSTNTKIVVNLNKNILANADELNIEKIPNPIITESDLNKMRGELISTRKYKYTKNTKTIYVYPEDNLFKIYVQDTNEFDYNNFVESILNVIKILNLDTYESLKALKEEFTRSVQTEKYEINAYATFDKEEDVFNPEKRIISITIYQ